MAPNAGAIRVFPVGFVCLFVFGRSYSKEDLLTVYFAYK
jgi:hypothetical protein